DIMYSLEHPSSDRLFHIKDAFELGVPLESIRKATNIDKWFLTQIQELVTLETELRRYQLNNIPKDFFITLKQKGYSDTQIAWLLGTVPEDDVYNRRWDRGIRRMYKMINTSAAEFPAHTPFYYSTFEEEIESVASDKKKIIVL